MIDSLVSANSVLVIMGPTASGKTQLALALADQLPIEIISMDSALIYRHMDIGTAKPSAEELAKVPHHLIDILDPLESYSAADFIRDTKRLVGEIHQRGRLPVLVGGTMMYLHALQAGLATLPSADETIRQRLLAQYQQDPAVLHQTLTQVDPVAAERIHPNDPQRLVRALEVFELTAKPLSQWQAEQEQQKWDVNLIKVALIPEDRSRLHQQIEQRLQKMFESGFLHEVEQLYTRGDLNPDLSSIRCVGYRQVWQYLAGEIDWITAQQKALVATRQLAKRQITWLRKEQDLLTLDPFVINLDDQLAKLYDCLHKNSYPSG